MLALAHAAAPARARAWGPRGHALVTRAAVDAAAGLPAWFREAEAALVELSIAPDRRRRLETVVPALRGRAPEHYFELDLWGGGTLPADRWRFLREAQRRRLDVEDVGILPYALLEEYGILASAFGDHRAGRPGAREDALVTAGTIAHLAADAAVPLHATRHHDGWVGDNPRGFRRSRGVHRWFETDMVPRRDPSWLGLRPRSVGPAADVRGDLLALLAASLEAVPRVYEAERSAHRARDRGPAEALVRERAAAGARLLASIWGAAWEESGRGGGRTHED